MVLSPIDSSYLPMLLGTVCLFACVKSDFSGKCFQKEHIVRAS